MNTLGTTKQTTTKKEESWSINNGYVCEKACIKGTIVKLNTTTGDVLPVTAVTDIPFGVVTVGCKEDGGDVTVTTQYVGIYYGIASGKLTVGDEIQAEAVDSTTGLTKYAPDAGTGKVVGHALEDIEDTENGWVGIFRVFTNSVSQL